jgi:hypothetical protein
MIADIVSENATGSGDGPVGTNKFRHWFSVVCGIPEAETKGAPEIPIADRRLWLTQTSFYKKLTACNIFIYLGILIPLVIFYR